VSMLVGLLLISVGVLVGLVLELERLQIDKVLRFTGDFGRSLIEKLYPLLDSTCGESPNCEFRALPVTQRADYRGPPRVIQSLDLAALTELAERSGGIIEMASGVGDTLVEGTSLLVIYGARELIPERTLWRAVKIGSQRTFEQDPKYAIRLVVDV